VLGFTRRETAVLLFLSVGFIVGLGVRIYQQRWVSLPELLEEKRASQSVSEAYFDGAGEAGTEKETMNESISLNKATCEELNRLPGIGPIMAERIVEYREECGEFRSIEELVKVKGIGEKNLEKLKPYLELN